MKHTLFVGRRLYPDVEVEKRIVDKYLVKEECELLSYAEIFPPIREIVNAIGNKSGVSDLYREVNYVGINEIGDMYSTNRGGVLSFEYDGIVYVYIIWANE